MKEKTILKLWAMSLISILEVVNLLYFKVDGTILSLVIGAICGLAGYELGKKREEKENSYFWTTYQSTEIQKRK